MEKLIQNKGTLQQGYLATDATVHQDCPYAPLNSFMDPGVPQALNDFYSYHDTVFTKKVPQGKMKKYETVTRKIYKEKLKFYNDTELKNFDIDLADGGMTKKVRRIVEKRMCQEYHRKYGKSVNYGRFDSYQMKSATSFQLHNLGLAECKKGYTRSQSTHWKKVYDPIEGKVVLKKKAGYTTYERALVAAQEQVIRHPEDPRPIHVYKCAHCHQWHIGHYTPECEKSNYKKLVPEIPITQHPYSFAAYNLAL